VKLLRRRPSPALVIALIALFVSLSGVSYGVATGFIDSREIKNNSVRTKDLRNNDVRTRDLRNNDVRTGDLRNNEVRGRDIRNSTVRGIDVGLNAITGADVRESTLGKVPSATIADSATTATNATNATNAQSAASVGGMTVKKFFAKVAVGAPTAEIFRGNGFALLGGCGGAGPILNLNGITGVPQTNVAVQGDAGGTVFNEYDADLNAGDNLPLTTGATTQATGTAVVSTTAGAVSTVSYAAEDSPAFSGENVCALRGTVVAG
jgi:hypothetical protein